MKAYLQLVRLPNVFTAMADSLAGVLLVRGVLGPTREWLPLVLASAATYAGGIALNDVCDAEIDRVERPDRPIPSGRVPLRSAWAISLGLLGAGLLLAFAASERALFVEIALVACVVAYNARLKHTRLGPLVMGACRGLNLLLGASTAEALGGPVLWIVASAYAVYIIGITWISRSEVDAGSRKNILIGIVLKDLAILGFLAAAIERSRFPSHEAQPAWTLAAGLAVLVAIALLTGRKTLAAYRRLTPATIQASIKVAILSLIWLHVGLLLAVRGVEPAALVALFWIPAAYSGRWIYST